MEENELLYKNQIGFRKQHYTSHAIITLVGKVSNALDMGEIVVGVLVDLKKAFDNIIKKTISIWNTWICT